MAHPGYPQQMPQMGPPMGGPQQMMMPPRPVRRGTSRAVPIVVSAGLAMGVFCGLLFGLGTGEVKAAADPAKGNNVGKHGDDTAPAAQGGAAPAGLGGTAALPVGATPAAAGGSPTKNPNAIASGAKPAAAGTAPTVAAPKSIKLTFKVEPEAAASSAKIVVDGKEITGTEIEVPIDHKSVKIAVTANGFHSYDKKLDIVPDGDMTMTVEMIKRGGGGAPASPGFGGASTGGNHVPTAPPKPKKPANNGIIDI
jgi:hypothetical protein